MAAPTEADIVTERKTALWKQARGGNKIKTVKTFCIESSYTATAGSNSTFLPADLPPEIPLCALRSSMDTK